MNSNKQKARYLVDACFIVDGNINLLTTQALAVIGFITSNAPPSSEKNAMNNNPCISTAITTSSVMISSTQALTSQAKRVVLFQILSITQAVDVTNDE